MKSSEKKEFLSNLSEDEFRKDVIIPLLKKMGYTEVRERHGAQEIGKDITFKETTPLRESYSAVVAKIGSISGGASTPQNLQTVLTQVHQAFDVCCYDIENKKEFQISNVIVWTSGKISNNAQTQIQKSLSKDYQHVDFKDYQSTIDLLDDYFPDFFIFQNPRISEYFRNSSSYYCKIEELRSLGTSGEKVTLPQIFVPPLFKKINQKKNAIESPLEPDHVNFNDFLKSDFNTLIMGQLGSGKSTILRNSLISIIDDNKSNGKVKPIPIIINAKNIELSNNEAIEHSLITEYKRFISFDIEEEGLNFNDGSIIVLIDGLDELRDEEKIDLLINKINDFSNKHKKTRIIITSRKLRVLESQSIFTDFTIYEIEDLGPSSIKKFINLWFGEESEVGNRLNNLIQDPLTKHGLPSTPMTVTLLAILFTNGIKDIPANLTELFQKYTELTIGKWDIERDINQQFEWHVKEFCLIDLAWFLQNESIAVLSYKDFLNKLNLISQERVPDLNKTDFINEIIGRSELLIKNMDGVIEFKHRALQDFFAGKAINIFSNEIDFVVEHFLDDWWERAVFFCCGLKPACDEFIINIVEKIHPNDENLIRYTANLGYLIQAGFLVKSKVKEDTILIILNNLLKIWGFLISNLPEGINEKIKSKQISLQLIFIEIISYIAQQALGSITLIKHLEKITDNLLKSYIELNDPSEKIEDEWKLFFLGCTFISCGKIDLLLNIINSNIIQNPALVFLINFNLSYYKLKNNYDSKTNDQIREIQKKLNKKIKKNKKYLTDLYGIKPIPLSESSE